MSLKGDETSGVHSLSFREWFRERLWEPSRSLNSRSLPIPVVVPLGGTGQNSLRFEVTIFFPPKQKNRFSSQGSEECQTLRGGTSGWRTWLRWGRGGGVQGNQRRQMTIKAWLILKICR